MKYRIMTNDKVTDFDKESDALSLFTTEKDKVEKAEITTVDGMEIVPFVSYHICHHGEGGNTPCVIINQVTATKEKVK
jgi:hypothetical protein